MGDATMYGSSTHLGQSGVGVLIYDKKVIDSTNVPFIDDRDRVVAYAQLLRLRNFGPLML